MLGAQQHVVGCALFDHLAVLKHDHAIGNLGDDAEIMGDEHDGHVAAALQVADQFKDLRLRRDVERGGRLIATSTAGSSASAMAIMARWRWPPDS
jgi:hypothetical protein